LFSLHLNNKFLDLPIEQVKVAAKLWYQANARSNTRKSIERERLEREQRGDVIEVEVDLTDIDKLFAEQGQGRHMLEIEFEPTTETEVEYVSRRTGKLTKRWTWKHKLMGTTVHRNGEDGEEPIEVEDDSDESQS
jgi:hypothetical protein